DIVRSVESATVREGCWESDRTSPSRSRRRSLTMRTVGPGCWRFDLGRVCGCDPTIVSAPCVSMTNPDGTRELEQLESRQTCEVLNDHTAASTRGCIMPYFPGIRKKSPLCNSIRQQYHNGSLSFCVRLRISSF